MPEVYIYSALSILLVVLTVALVLCRGIEKSIMTASLYSAASCLVYLLLSAPDVAITEAAVGVGVTTILCFKALGLCCKAGTLLQTSQPTAKAGAGNTQAAVLLGTLIAVWVKVYFLFLPLLPTNLGFLSNYYISNTAKDIGIKNIVTAILASYRGFDTMGETMVIISAAVGVTAITRSVNVQD